MVKEDIMRSIFSADDELDEEETCSLITQLDNMKAAKVKMEEVREENETLKLTLSQMMKKYHSLKMQLNGAVRDDRSRKTTNSAPMAASDDESELVCLSLGRFDSRKEEKKTRNVNLENCGLELGLDWKSHSGDCTEATNDLKLGNSFDEAKEDGNDDVVRSPEKSPKTLRGGDDEILQYNPAKKPRVSVKAVCNTQTMHDGCQWRKYGQKVAKGNPCPRAYYRCTASSSCPVRKQVQRCMDDIRILTTTYEGTHNHPLPPSATAMASTTSAAAAMLNCSSTASANRFPSPNNLITIASSQSHPTVILDLTAPNRNINKSSSTLFSATHSSTSLNFSSSNPQIGWENRFHTLNNTNFIATPYSQPLMTPKQTANDLAQATQAITRDPTFQSALAAAITSFVGSNDGQGSYFNLNFSQPSTSNGSIGCGPSFLNKFSPMVNSQQMNLTRFAPVTLSASKSQAVSLADEGDERELS